MPQNSRRSPCEIIEGTFEKLLRLFASLSIRESGFVLFFPNHHSGSGLTPLIQPDGLSLKLRHFAFQVFVLIEFDLQEPDGDPRFFPHPLRSQVIQVRALAFVVTKVVDLYEALLCQGLQTEVDSPEAYPQFAGDIALTRGRIFFKKLKNAVAVFVGQHRLMFND